MKSTGIKYDVIFVGSSQTQNHIDCTLLESYGLHSFNLGLAGRFFNESLYPTEQAAIATNKLVVLSIPLGALFNHLKLPKFPVITELKYFWTNYPEMRKEATMTAVLGALPINRFEAFWNYFNANRDGTKATYKKLKNIYHDDKIRNFDDILYIRGNPKNRSVVVYKNGDGQVFANLIKQNVPIKKLVKINQEFNPTAIKFLRDLSKMVRSYSARLVINIAPSIYSLEIAIDKEKLQRLLPDAFIIDSQCVSESKYWADRGHLNTKGNVRYTTFYVINSKR